MQLFNPETRCMLLLNIGGVTKGMEGVHHVTYSDTYRVLECFDEDGKKMVVGGRDFTFMLTEMPSGE